MNNNRQPNNNNNNNRRRGRNNSNRPQNNNNRNGYDNQNRVDNRARGNASQMLEKYKKLASDAQMIGDRVNAEYFLQFADHYFRVLADTRSRQEARQEEQQSRPRRDDRDDWQNEESRDNNFAETDNHATDNDADDNTADGSDEGEQAAPKNERPRRPERSRTPRRHHSEEPRDDDMPGLDLAVLPPSIAISPDGDEAELAKPARKPRARRPKSANDEDAIAAAE